MCSSKYSDLGKGTRVDYSKQQEEERKSIGRWSTQDIGTYNHQSQGLFHRVTQAICCHFNKVHS